MRNGNELFMISWEKRPLCIHSYAIISNTLCENKKCLGQKLMDVVASRGVTKHQIILINLFQC